MPRGPISFKQSDLIRAWKASEAKGLQIMRTEIAPDGRIVIVHNDGGVPIEMDPFDAWKAKQSARPA